LQRFYIIPIDCSMRLTFPLKIDSDKLSRFLVAMSTGSGKGNVPKSSRWTAFLYKLIYFGLSVCVILI